jgi:hypothetical protein
MDSRLTAEDLDWLRKLKAAADAKRDAPQIPVNVVVRLAKFGLPIPAGSGAFTITPEGRDALLDQDMRDAEDR